MHEHTVGLFDHISSDLILLTAVKLGCMSVFINKKV